MYKYAVESRVNRRDGTPPTPWLRYFYSKTKKGAEAEKAWAEKNSMNTTEYRIVKL